MGIFSRETFCKRRTAFMGRNDDIVNDPKERERCTLNYPVILTQQMDGLQSLPVHFAPLAQVKREPQFL